ncbi:MAG: lysophospholipid acyltransferase family protein [Anaerolineae bacterium]
MFWFLQRLFRFLVSILSRVHVEGAEQVPDERPLLFITNHMHWLDVPVVGAFLPCRATVLVASKHERSLVLGTMFRSVGAIFVRRGEADRKAFLRALHTLESGLPLAIAPEGTRSPTMSLQKGKPGPALLAWKAKAVIVPVVGWGHEDLFPSLRRGRRANVHVVFGKPFRLPGADQVEKRPSHEQLEAWTDFMMQRLAELLPPKYRGYYA